MTDDSDGFGSDNGAKTVPRLLKLALKWALIGVAFSVGCAAVFGAVTWGVAKYWESRESEGQAARDNRLELVQVKVDVDPAICIPGPGLKVPLVIEITNGSDRTITYTRFRVDAHKPNYSGSEYIVRPLVDTDRIIEPNKKWMECQEVDWPFNSDDVSQLIWSADDEEFFFLESE